MAKAFLRLMRRDFGLDLLDALPRSARGGLPLSNRPRAARPPREPRGEALPAPPDPWAGGSREIAASYAKRSLSPTELVHHILTGVRFLDHIGVGPLVGEASPDLMADAEAATERYFRGVPRGPLDGVPVLVKEQIAVRGLPHLGGTSYFDATPSKDDAFAIKKLREAGALIVGHSAMTELGMSPLGNNPHRKMPRNPFAEGFLAGGSSTGSGVAVGTGLVPIAVGVDGGGSIRIPAAHNGVFGLKPSWGRVSRHGDILQNSVNHTGPIASSVLDLARALDVMSAIDTADEEMLHGGAVRTSSFERAVGRGVQGLVIGYDRRAIDEASSELRKGCERAMTYLVEGGAILREVSLPLANVAAQIGFLTLGMEALAGVARFGDEHGSRMGPDVRLTLSVLEHVPARTLADAALLRAGLREEMKNAFAEIDLLVTPTTLDPPPRGSDVERNSGFLDGRAVLSACRYTFLANLTGLPAGTAPIGFDSRGLPLGVQFVGDAYDEGTVLAALAHLERSGRAEVRAPKAHVRVLK